MPIPLQLKKATAGHIWGRNCSANPAALIPVQATAAYKSPPPGVGGGGGGAAAADSSGGDCALPA
jgi:hypothetical protein